MSENYRGLERSPIIDPKFKVLADAYEGKFKILSKAKERNIGMEAVLTQGEKDLLLGMNKVIVETTKFYMESLQPRQHSILQMWEAKINSLELDISKLLE